MSESLDFLNVTFSYDTLATPLIVELTERFPVGWTGIVGANGAGKTTILCLAVGELSQQVGHIQRPRPAIYCPQRTDDPPDMLGEFLLAPHAGASELRGRLGRASRLPGPVLTPLAYSPLLEVTA